jgi:spermidine synthase
MKAYKIIFSFCFAIVAIVLVSPIMAIADEEILFEGDSIYHHITIRQTSEERCMLFGRYRDHRETCIDLKEADLPVFEYTEMMFAGFLLQPEIKEVLLIGLGGGYIPNMFSKYLPDVKLHVVEIDPFVYKLAKQYFQFKTSSTVTLEISDGRIFLKRSKLLFDQIWVDAFNSDYVPQHMTTKEFLLLAKSKLNNPGLLVQNVHNDNKLYDAQILTFRSVFKYVYILKGEKSGNSIIIATDNSQFDDLINNPKKPVINKIGKIDLLEQVKKYDNNPIIQKTKILTDDYAPANLLLQQH